MTPLETLAGNALARDTTAPAIEFERRWYSWGELRAVADRIESLIVASGAGLHAPIALVARNRPSAIAALLGLVANRRLVRMVYAFQSAAALAQNLERIEPAVVVAHAEDLSNQVRSVLGERAIAAIALEGMDLSALPGLERSQCDAARAPPSEPRIEILTSGTTGPPKQFAVSYELIAKFHIGTGPVPDLSQAPPTLLSFPLGNITGIYSTLPPLLKGQRGILLERFSVAGWHDYVVRFKPEATGMPPAGVQMVLDANIPKEDLVSIKRFGTGAAPLDPVVHRAWEERYGIPILLSYGATEFGGPVTAMTPELHAQWGSTKFGSVGRAMPGAQLRVIDPDTEEVLPPGKEGVLEVISPRIGPEWIRTSDVALIDEDGFVFHRGRADGAIMRGGFKLLPETIERALMLHPAISAAAVIGISDRRLGQVPAAAIQCKPGVDVPDAATLEAHVRQHLPATHVPVHWRFVDELPRTLSMKVHRPGLKKLFEVEAA
jgi:long-chain acyl-CoA synthetase